MAIDEIELGHQQINGDHTHKRREHTQNQRAFHQRFTPFEFEGRDDVRRQNHENGA